MAETIKKRGTIKKKETAVGSLHYMLTAFFLLSFVAGLVLIFRGAEEQPSVRQGAVSGRSGIAVVPINGVIQFAAQGGFLGRQQGAASVVALIRQYIKNSQVKGIVLRINSPGGSIGATQEIYNALQDFKKSGRPVIASMADVAASGGYYLACAADEIYANGGTITGSIGVIMSAPDMKGLYDWVKVKWNVIKSGRFKDILSPYRHMRADERQMLTGMVRDAYQQFFKAVLVARRVTQAKLRRLAQGQIFSGRQAKQEGLIDKVADFETALLRAGKLAGIKGRPFVIKPRQRASFSELLRLFGKIANAASQQGITRLAGTGRRLPLICYLYRGGF